MQNPDLAYLMGMIVGKGFIVRGREETEYRIEIPHKNLEIEGMDAQLSVKASLLDIKQRLDPLIDANMRVTTEDRRTLLSFTKKNGSYLATELNRMLTFNNYKDFRIPSDIFEASHDVKLEFIRGLADVTGHIRSSNLAFGDPASHRVYIEIPVNWFLVVDICNLLKEVDVPVQTVNWGHPNFRDPNRVYYIKGNHNYWWKEHQIKLWADEFEAVGFNIVHKRRALQELADTNRTNWSRKKPIEASHHKFYWELPDRNRSREPHPMVDNEKIPAEIRGENFSSWKDLSRKLGYHE